MKVRTIETTGCPVPSFSIEAETEHERMLLHAFLRFPLYAKEDWFVQLQSESRRSGESGPYAFNVGWTRRREPNADSASPASMQAARGQEPKEAA